MPHTRPSVPEDVPSIAARLRAEDVAEVVALGDTPLGALQGGLRGTQCHTIVGDSGSLIGMFGIHHFPAFGPAQAAVWMLATDELPSIKTEMFRQTAPILSRFHALYPLLWNVVDARNELHIRWLKRFGFVALKKHERVGPQQLPFYEFVRIDHV